MQKTFVTISGYDNFEVKNILTISYDDVVIRINFIVPKTVHGDRPTAIKEQGISLAKKYLNLLGIEGTFLFDETVENEKGSGKWLWKYAMVKSNKSFYVGRDRSGD